MGGPVSDFDDYDEDDSVECTICGDGEVCRCTACGGRGFDQSVW